MTAGIRVPRRTLKELDRVEGDLIVDSGTVRAIKPGFMVKVTGVTDCNDDCIFESSLSTTELRGKGGDVTVEGDLEVEKSIKINRGSLEVFRNLKAEKLDVDRSTRVSGEMLVEDIRVGGTVRVKGVAKAYQLDVGGSFRAESDTEIDEIDVGGSVNVDGKTKSKSISVGGSFKGYGHVEASIIDVGGTVRIDAKVDLDEIDVGGSVRLSGGSVKTVKVGGSFRSSKPINFENIRVGGTVKIAGGSGENIDVGGTLRCDGDLTFDAIDVGGTVRIDGNAKGNNVEVGGTIKVRNSLNLTKDLRVGGKAQIGNDLNARSVLVGGKVEAEKIVASEEIRTNILCTREGAKSDYIELGRRGEAEGPLIARKVLIRERARVEEVYAETVTLRRGARAVNLYANEIIIENDCRISGNIMYTKELRTDRDVRFSSEPEKTEKLPEPPF